MNLEEIKLKVIEDINKSKLEEHEVEGFSYPNQNEFMIPYSTDIIHTKNFIDNMLNTEKKRKWKEIKKLKKVKRNGFYASLKMIGISHIEYYYNYLLNLNEEELKIIDKIIKKEITIKIDKYVENQNPYQK